MAAFQRHDQSHRRREFLGGAMLGVAGGIVGCSDIGAVQSAAAADAKPRKQTLRPAGAPSADASDSPGILAEGSRLLFVSGQGPEDVKADMETQIRQTFDRIGLILKAGGASFENVVIVRSFWVHLARDLPIFRKVRRDYLVEPYPASTAVGTTELAIPGLELEIEAVAIL
jgi:enamine deaminase RidA (YjgF/YER057c/UK114 family)